MVTIACVWYNNWPNNDEVLGIEYVNKLYRSVKRNTNTSFRFVCLTDNSRVQFDDGVERMVCDFSKCNRGEIGKIMLYNPDNGFPGRVIGLDLDTVIKGNLDPFLQRKEPFLVKKNPRPHRFPHLNGIGGDAVSFIAEKYHWLWDKQKQNPNVEGDERVFYVQNLKPEEITFWQDLFPRQYLSYKRHLRNLVRKGMYVRLNNVLDRAVLISFHGKPRPHQVQDAWLKPYWHEV